ncbi:MAG: PEP/pyruvate-binding domain-containing protein [bacterium]
MKWLRTLLRGTKDGSPESSLRSLQQKFTCFLDILENNNRVLHVISDMEEKSQGEYLFDINYIRTSLREIRTGAGIMIEKMNALGGEERYAVLRGVLAGIEREIESILPGGRPLEPDDFTLPLEALDRHTAPRVGSKSANLGEMKRLGLPVPEGFAISAWAYQHFMDVNRLGSRIADLVSSVDFKRYEDLIRVSREARAMVTASTVPEDLARAIRQSHAHLVARSGAGRMALRSSAVGEDTLFSFAGQYATFLNLAAEDDLVEHYREVLASKFTPQAIYYLLSHDLAESEQAMSVACVGMVEAACGGVAYSRDPLRPEEDHVLVHSVFGLGKYVVDGTVTPDMFRVSRSGRGVLDRRLAAKRVRLAANPEGGTAEEPVPEGQQNAPSIGDAHLAQLAAIATRLEQHYGCPQDIEFAVDGRGRLFLLQTRPLRVIQGRPRSGELELSVRPEVLMTGGTTVSPGAGSGPVVHASSTQDLAQVRDGVVLVAPRPFPGLITAMEKASALVTELGGTASHMATLAREYRIPTLVGLEGARALPAGRTVTVDATAGVIYQGAVPELVEARRPEYELLSDTGIFKLLERVLERVSPLNLLNPSDESFVPQNCRTIHDITRFCHQRSMEEMFHGASSIENKDPISLRLKSDIPLQVNIIYIDRDRAALRSRRTLEEDELGSVPMEALWSGIKQQGWPSRLPAPDLKGFMAVMATTMAQGNQPEFSENSFAVLGKEYMILSLRMGYHFTTVEAMCASEPNKNFIRMQYKGGGSAAERRVRRISLVTEILSRIGFESAHRADFLYATLAYDSAEAIRSKLRLLGRLIMMTKQLDMALSSDAITRWYTDDFLKQLGLADRAGGPT